MTGHEPKKKPSTVRFQYPFGSTIPKEEEFTALLKEREVAEDHVDAIYSERKRRSILVKFKTQELADNFLDKAGYTISFKYSNDVKVDLKISDANVDVTMVRIFELPPEIEDDEVIEAFKTYGVVKTVMREHTNPRSGFAVYNGIRRIFMEITDEIPNLMSIDGVMRRVYYDGQTEICFRCQKEGHKRFACPLAANNRPFQTDRTGTNVRDAENVLASKNYVENAKIHVDKNKVNKNTAIAPEKASTTQEQITTITVDDERTGDNSTTATLQSEPVALDKNNTESAKIIETTTVGDTRAASGDSAVMPPPVLDRKARRKKKREELSSGSNEDNKHDNKLQRRDSSADSVASRTRSRSRSVSPMEDDEL